MKSKIYEHYNSRLPVLLGVHGVTFRNHIFYVYEKEHIPARLRIHEEEHVRQYQLYGTCGFLIVYLIEYIQGRLKGLSHNDAYLNITFEKEARKVELLYASTNRNSFDDLRWKTKRS